MPLPRTKIKNILRNYQYERETFVRLLDYAVREGIILDNPARIIQRHKVRTHRPDIPTKKQFKTIAGWLGHKDGGLLVAKTYGHLRDEHSATMAQRMTFGV